MFETQGLQKPRFNSLANGVPSIEEYVFETMNILYRDFSHHVTKIPSDRFCEVRYEDLIRSPVTEIDRIYRRLNLGKLNSFGPKLESHLQKLEGYKRNEYRISEDQKAEICRRWHWYIDRYGYNAV